MPALRADASRNLPLFVDMDGSLVLIDTTLYCAVALSVRRPLALLRVLARARGNRARLKQELAAATTLDPARLPYHAPLLAYLRGERAAGRRLLLATGADQRVAAAVARHLGIFDAVLASDGRVNLTGAAKLAAIRGMIGDRPFSYVGNSRADLAVWRGAAAGVCVNARPGVLRAAARVTAIERIFPRNHRYRWPMSLLRVW